MKVRVHPDPVLREQSKDVTIFDKKLKDFVSDMIQTMEEHDGVGLAAVQVGMPKKILIFKTIGEEEVENKCIINPEIIEIHGSTSTDEGCLSLPGISSTVKRASKIKVKAKDFNGNDIVLETDKFWAVIIQHEIDHLNGKLFVDRLSTIKRKLVMGRYRKQ